MVTNIPVNGASLFRMRRPAITSNGFTAELDSTIKAQLEELDHLLGSRVFALVQEVKQNGHDTGATAKATATSAATASASATTGTAHLVLTTELQKPLIPKRTTSDAWDNTGILNDLYNNRNFQKPQYMTIGDCIDRTNALASLKFDFQTQTNLNYNFLDFNSRNIFSYKNTTDYLLAYAYFIKGITEVNGLLNFINTNKEGLAAVVNYAVISGARYIIRQEALNIPDFDAGGGKIYTYNDDLHPLMVRIAGSPLSLTAVSFKTSLQKIIDDYVFNGHELHLIETAGIGTIPDEIKPMLVKYIKNSPVPITPDNVKFFLPLFISQIAPNLQVADTTVVDQTESDKDFDVQFLEDDSSAVQISVSNVKCAAQLYYCMVLGEELEVFNVVNYFTHKFLIRGGIEIQDQKLRENLQQYVFSNKFVEQKSGKIYDRTRPAERQMFYRQVFNYGKVKISDEVIVNNEFGRMWKVLMLETAKYLERAQDSPNPDNYVSRQNVMQAVEDLQYNLSTHCSGMTNVITPLIYEELNFVIRNILMHPEVTRQVVPVGGTWWRVVETLFAAMKSTRPKATVMYNKAKLGQVIIRSIAEYNPATFEDDKNFSEFISNADAFITTQSIIQESLPHEIRKDRAGDDDGRMNGHMEHKEHDTDESEAPKAAAPKAPGKDEWDF